MTPIETYEYKLSWLPGRSVPIHSDHADKCKSWCRKNLPRHQWSMSSWSNVYEHTFHFELDDDAMSFKSFMVET